MVTFDVVWETVRDTHWDPELNGVDWEAARERFRPAVQTALSMFAARGAMRDMLDLLKQSHFGILPSQTGFVPGPCDRTPHTHAATADQELATQSGALGLHVRVFNEQALVTRVEPGLPAEAAGVQPGWELIAVNERTVAACLEHVSKSHADASADLVSERSFTIHRMLRVEQGESVALTFDTPDGVRILHQLQAVEPEGALAAFGHLTPIHVQIESRRLSDGQIGYLTFNVFLDPETIMPAFERAVRDFAGCDGVILDLRGNPGGIGAMAMGMAGFFLTERGSSLGTMQSRDATLEFIVFPRPRAYTGRLAILIDEMSASTAEILAAGLQDLERARLFGRHTAGAALPSHIRDLPNGDRLQHAVANFLRTDGRSLENHGVEPDQVVIPTREQLSAGEDPVLEAAKAWILGGPLLSLAVQ